MLHFKRLAIGASLLLAFSLLPASGEATNIHLLMQRQTMEASMDPGGFNDLFWGETLEEVKSRYPVSFIGYNPGDAEYGIDMRKVSGWKFEGLQLAIAFLRLINWHVSSLALPLLRKN